MLIGTAAVSLIANPWEEAGWRGFALPRLQARFGAMAAALIVGAMWALWHAPLFWWTGNPMAEHPVIPWLAAIMAQSAVFAWLYNGSGGSLAVVTLFHIAFNTAGAAMGGSMTGTAAAACAAAVLVVLVAGPGLLSETQAGKTGAAAPG